MFANNFYRNSCRIVIFLLLILTTIGPGGCKRENKTGPVILVTIDTLRYDHLGMSGYPRATSPFIDSLAAAGANFVRAMSSSSHTAPSHASMFTGLQPSQHRVLSNGQNLEERYLTIAEMFKRNGYETAAFTSIFFLYGLRNGFDVFDVPMKQYVNNTRFRPANATINQAMEWISAPERSRQSFLWIHLYDVHQSLPEFKANIQQEYLQKLKQNINERRWIRFLIRGNGHNKNVSKKRKLLEILDHYDAQILNVDTELHRLYDAVKTSKRFKNALWIITADHGEGLGNHGYLGHGERVYQEQLHVPLIFHYSNGRHPAQKIESLVRHVDLLPTIAEMMKWKLTRQPFSYEGVSLAPLIRGDHQATNRDYAFAQRRPPDDNWRSDWEKGEIYSLQTSRYKYIEHTEGPDEFYDLQTDPFELRNLTSESREKENLRKSLAEMYSRFIQQSNSLPLKPAAIEKEYEEELKALGYIN